MICPRCGAQMLPDSSFCGVCGNRIDSGASLPGHFAGAGIHIDEDSRGQGRGYSYEVLHQPAFSLAIVQLQPEQSIQAEAGAMVSMSANVELQSEMAVCSAPSSVLPASSPPSFPPLRLAGARVRLRLLPERRETSPRSS